ncbi:MAG TPA: serine hydrolase domain-containing protein [Microbacteriaceae bacterium]
MSGLLRSDAWPGFRAPTPELTKTLRVRDLLGMASGIGESTNGSGWHEGDPSAGQLLQSVVNLPVIDAPGKTFFYNNTVFAVGGYLPFLFAGVAEADLSAAYGEAMHTRVYEPTGMKGALIADDPRRLVSNYAAAHGPDLRGKQSVLPYGPVGSFAPIGGTLATLRDMAAYVRLQLGHGVAANGKRVVSAANLAECWKPTSRFRCRRPNSTQIVRVSAMAWPGLAWNNEKFTDDTSLISHTGGIDGFSTFIGFVQEHDTGIVVLNSMNPGPNGSLFGPYVVNVLLSGQFGLNRGGADAVLAASRAAAATCNSRAARGSSRCWPCPTAATSCRAD